MKIKQLRSVVTSRYTLRPEEMEQAQRELQEYKKWFERPDLGRTITFGVGEQSVECSGPYGIHKGRDYSVVIVYSPPAELSQRHIATDLFHADGALDLPFSKHFSYLTLSDADIFHGEFSYSDGGIINLGRKKDKPGPSYVTEVRVEGMPTPRERSHLRQISTSAYFPQTSDGKYFTTETGSGGMSGGMPEIILVKRWDGEFDPEAERRICEFYDAVRDFVLERSLTERFQRAGRPPHSELVKEHHGIDMRADIEESRAYAPSWFGPHPRIDISIPYTDVYQELTKRNGHITRNNVVDVMNLTYFSPRKTTKFPQG